MTSTHVFRRKHKREGFTRTELVISLLVVGIFTAVFIPFLLKQRKETHRKTCLSNLRRIGEAIRGYIGENDGYYPGNELWCTNRISKYPLAGCPAAQPLSLGAQQSSIRGYAYNQLLGSSALPIVGVRESAVHNPGQTVSVCEEANDISITQQVDSFRGQAMRPLGREEGFKRHDGGAHYLFCDGHIQWYKPEAVHEAEPLYQAGVRRETGDGPTFAL